ncbi:OLC1v1020766C1 [Oldenlandia corymbosa var. corymbosa]|nr:OLC1v1020766C1 [Oldenlandia corymbosa var. corymbosa]
MGVESYPHLAVVAVKDNKEIDVVRLENLTSNEGRSLLLAVERTANQAKTKDTGEGKKTTNGGLLSKLPGLTAKKVETTTVASKPESTATVKITGAPKLRTTVDSLEQMGVKVSGVATSSEASPSKCDISWDTFAGYDQQKREIEDTILLALRHPQVYDKISRSTRTKFEPNRPKAMLFEGPPGTGKTSCARVIASQAGIPFLHVPIEAIMSKWFGESSKLLAKIFSLAREFPTGAIIFLDEVDSLGGSRNKGMTHETTRRILSILLRQIDGFEQDSRVVVVAATNRKEDLDPALISRFESSVYFGLPDEQTRRRIAARYAKHLTESELAEFARVTIGMADRDIKDVCLQAERHWASKVIRGRVRENVDEKLYSPPLQEYIESAMNR